MILMKKLAALAVLPLALAGCSNTASTSTGSADATSPVDVITEVYAFTWVAEKVGGDRVSVTQLIPSGTPVHGYEVSPSQIADMSAADLVVFTDGVATAVDDAVVEAKPAHVVDATEYIEVLPATEHHHDEEEGHEEEGHDEEGHEDEGGEEEHDHGNFDPHTWLALNQLPVVVDAVTDALTEADPDGAETYAANAEALNADLAELDEEYSSTLASCELNTIVVTHPAFGYIAHAYGLEQVGISGFDEDTEPSPARIAEVAEVAKDTNATTIYLANTSNPKVAEVLASDLGLKTSVLSTLTGAGEGQDYLSLAEQNLTALSDGLGCS
jgi:zinc transport system substrate-binding protein